MDCRIIITVILANLKADLKLKMKIRLDEARILKRTKIDSGHLLFGFIDLIQQSRIVERIAGLINSKKPNLKQTGIET